jgi:hypothetical protein
MFDDEIYDKRFFLESLRSPLPVHCYRGFGSRRARSQTRKLFGMNEFDIHGIPFSFQQGLD